MADINKIVDGNGNAYNFRDSEAARNTPTFSQASSRANLNGSGETMPTILGKIKKWFADLKALAFKDMVSDSDVNGKINDNHIASASRWNGKQDALSSQDAYSAKGSATKVPQITTNSLGQVTRIDEVTITQPDISGKVDKITKVNGHALSEDVTVTKSDVGLGNLPNVNPGISHMYFNTRDYALRINVGDFTIRNAGVSLLVQAVCNNGYVALIEISCWKGRENIVERVEAHVLYRNNRSSGIPQFVSYKASTSAENYIYIYSKTSDNWSTSFTVLGNSQRLAENNESLVCEQVSRDEATASGTTEVSVGVSDAFVATRASTGTDANNTKPADIYNAIRDNRPIIVHDMYREADEYQYVLVDPSSNSNKVRLTCLYIDNSTNSYQRLNAYEITLSNGNGKWDDIDVDLLKYTWATAQNSYFSGTSRLANYATNAGSSSSSEKLRKSIGGTDVDFAFDSSSSATKPKLALHGSEDPQLGVFATTATSGTSAHGVQMDADVSGENRVGVWGYHGGKSDWVCYKGSDAICGLGAPYKNSSNPGDQKVRLGRYLVDFSGAPPSESDTIAFM